MFNKTEKCKHRLLYFGYSVESYEYYHCVICDVVITYVAKGKSVSGEDK